MKKTYIVQIRQGEGLRWVEQYILDSFERARQEAETHINMGSDLDWRVVERVETPIWTSDQK